MRWPLSYRIALVALALLGGPRLAADYCPPSSPASSGMRDIMLIYGAPQQWTPADFRPYVAYLDPAGHARDWFYDAYLFLMYGGAPSGHAYIDGTTDRGDWTFFLDELFAPDRELAALDSTVAAVAAELGTPAPAVPVILMVPYPAVAQRAFGDVNGDGRAEDLSQPEDRARVVDWFLTECLARWQAVPRKHLQLWGFYWMNEGIPAADTAVVRHTAERVHARGLKFHWIPWFDAPGVETWRELGFDLVIMQPNYAFVTPTGGLAVTDENRLTVAANQCRRLGMGVEMELNEGLLADPAFQVNLQLYLDHGDEVLDGYQRQAVRAYYQGTSTIARLCRSPEPALRRLYDDLYAFHKGTYARRRPYQPLRVLGVDPATSGGTDLGCLADGAWSVRPEAATAAVTLAAPVSHLTFELPAPMTPLGDVRVHFPPGAEAPACLALEALADGPGGKAEPMASTESVALRADSGGFAILHTVPRPVHRLRLRVELAPGQAPVRIDEILALPAAHLLWGCPVTADTPVDGDLASLTDGRCGTDAGVTVPTDRPLGLTVAAAGNRFAEAVLVSFSLPTANATPPVVSLALPGALPSGSPTTVKVDNRGAVRLDVGRPLAAFSLRVAPGRAGERVVLDEIALLPAPNLALGCPYRLEPARPAKYPDTDDRELTDGQISAGFGDGRSTGWAAWNGAEAVAVTFDLGEAASVDGAEAYVQGGGAAAVEFPEAVELHLSADGRQWRRVALARGTPADLPALPAGSAKSALGWARLACPPTPARFARLRFQARGWLMLSEVRILSGGRDLAAGRAYALQPGPSDEGPYPDNTGKLTDGVCSRSANGWHACVGFDHADPTITVDLLHPSRIGLARLHVVGGGPGGVWFPTRLAVSTSEEGAAWTDETVTAERPGAESGKDAAVGFVDVPLSPRAARFVRFRVTRRGWAMPDEIEVFAAAQEAGR